MKEGSFFISGSGSNTIVYVYSQLFSTFGLTTNDSGKLKVFFVPNNGEDLIEKEVLLNEKIARPETNPVREGNEKYKYVFTNWYADEACTVPFDFNAQIKNDNTYIYAGWNQLTIEKVEVTGFSESYNEEKHEVTLTNENPDIDIYFSTSALNEANFSEEGSADIPSATYPTTQTYYWYADAYNCVADPSSGEVTIEVKMLESSVTGEPMVQSPTYDGQEHALLSAGQAEGGTMLYACGENATTAPEDGWSKEVPTAVDAGIYYVWYKVEGTRVTSEENPEGIQVCTDVDPICLEVNFNQAPADQNLSEDQKPTAKDGQTATGGSIALVNAPTSLPENCTKVQYSIDNGATWTDTVPTVIAAGTYTVRVKYVGNKNHADFEGTPITITVNAPAVAQEAAPQPAPASQPAPQPEPTPVIPVLKKNVKTKVSAAPGAIYQIDLGGKTGKGFKSSKKKVAVVDQNGLITIKAAGKTKITVKVGKKKRTLTLTVKDPTVPTRVVITASGPLTGKKGETVQLTATLPAGTDSAIKWKSSNKKVASVNSNGLVTFKKPGKAKITATAVRGKKKASVKVKATK